jgi:hypothetical protein
MPTELPDDFKEYLRSDDGKAASRWEISVLRVMRRAAEKPMSIGEYSQLRVEIARIEPGRAKSTKRGN